MTLKDFLKQIQEQDGMLKDRMIIFRDEKGGWDNVSAKVVGENIEFSLDKRRPFND